MAALESLLRRLYSQHGQLCLFCDQLFAKTAAALPEAMNCQAGCNDCCELESVNALEASVLNAAGQNILREHGGSHPSSTAQCIILKQGRCRLYGQRPIICRTHGLAFMRRADDIRSIHHCPRNFSACSGDELLASPWIIDEERISANLVRLNIAFCTIIGSAGLAGERFNLRNVLANDLPAAIIAAGRYL
jgi:uncharacterized protein